MSAAAELRQLLAEGDGVPIVVWIYDHADLIADLIEAAEKAAERFSGPTIEPLRNVLAEFLRR